MAPLPLRTHWHAVEGHVMPVDLSPVPPKQLCDETLSVVLKGGLGMELHILETTRSVLGLSTTPWKKIMAS
jgi:hypothetical protein